MDLNKADGNPPAESFKDLYEQYFRRIFWFMVMRFSDQETAQDLAQEVFTRFFKRYSTSTLKGNMGSYLYGIARNVAVDFRNDKNPLSRCEDVEKLDKLKVAYEPGVIDDLRLQTCLERQKEIDRQVLVLHYWMGEGHIDIARILGMKYAQARQRFRRARERMKICLEKE